MVRGAMVPGQQLPTHQQIQKRFRTTRVTVQRALDRLSAEGFVRSSPKIGRFVAERLPFASRYGLVFMSGPGNELPTPWSRFDRAITAAAQRLEARGDIRFAH